MKIIKSKYNSHQLYEVYENRKRTILDKIDNFGSTKAVIIGLIILTVCTILFSNTIVQNLPVVILIGIMTIFLFGFILFMIGAILVSFGGASELSPKWPFLLDVADLLAFCEDASEEDLKLLRCEDGLIAIDTEVIDHFYMEEWLQKAFKEQTLDLSTFDKRFEEILNIINQSDSNH